MKIKRACLIVGQKKHQDLIREKDRLEKLTNIAEDSTVPQGKNDEDAQNIQAKFPSHNPAKIMAQLQPANTHQKGIQE